MNAGDGKKTQDYDFFNEVGGEKINNVQQPTLKKSFHTTIKTHVRGLGPFRGRMFPMRMKS